MSNKLLHTAIFLVGLLAVCWVGIGYLGSNPLGAAVVLVIGASYIAGCLELYRYRQATATLHLALPEAPAAQGDLQPWLARLHPSLRQAVRLRVEGERVALPAPALTPYLVGLLVLLGMLGTLLGMMATLRGTGLALESAADLSAMRGALAAPVKGLAFAFGTSIVGVACSAMLGLLASLCRRERAQVVQRLDAEAAGSLRRYSQAHQREEALALIKRQTEVMPALVEQLQAMTAALERQHLASNEALLSRQDAFHQRSEAAYAQLGGSLERALKAGVGESAQAVNAALQPVVASTLSGLAEHARALQDTLGQGVRQHLQASADQLEGAARQAAQAWQAAAETQRQDHQVMLERFDGALSQVTQAFEQRTTQLLDTNAAQLQAATGQLTGATAAIAEAWRQATTEQQAHNQRTAQDLSQTLAQFSDRFEQRATELLEQSLARMDQSTDKVAAAWDSALAQQAAAHEALAARNAQALEQAAATVQQHAAGLVRAVDQSHAELQATLAAQDAQRLSAWAETLDRTGQRLVQQWERSGEDTATRQQQICDALERTARDIAAQGQAHAGQTIAEISRLVQAASEAPRAAAEVIAELRQKLSDSMVRDTALLEERTQLLGTLETLLGAVNHASTEQRGAIDALVSTSAELLERVGSRFTDHVQAQTGKLGEVAEQVTVGAVEVASLGDALGAAVQQFGETSQALLTRLESVENVLDKSLTRSDEQLAYYVAQAKEVIDLSMLAQRQIIEDLQQVGARQDKAGAQPA